MYRHILNICLAWLHRKLRKYRYFMMSKLSFSPSQIQWLAQLQLHKAFVDYAFLSIGGIVGSKISGGTPSNHTLDLYSSGITEFENCDEARVFLSNREDQCTKTLQFTHDRNAEIGRGNESFFQALKLASSGAADLAVTILNRMLDQEALPDVEALTVLRALTKVHLAEGNSSESLETSNRLLLFAEASGDDYLLAATCSLNARNYEHAGKHLERARSLGVPFTKLKGIATRVAGLTGDAYLMTRLGNCDV